jgi:hypothetical protein
MGYYEGSRLIAHGAVLGRKIMDRLVGYYATKYGSYGSVDHPYQMVY